MQNLDLKFCVYIYVCLCVTCETRKGITRQKEEIFKDGDRVMEHM